MTIYLAIGAVFVMIGMYEELFSEGSLGGVDLRESLLVLLGWPIIVFLIIYYWDDDGF